MRGHIYTPLLDRIRQWVCDWNTCIYVTTSLRTNSLLAAGKLSELQSDLMVSTLAYF